MNFWIRVWQFVSHHWCPTSWFSLPCFLNSNWLEFLHECTLGCLVYMWFFLELFVAFPNCLRFSPLFDQNVDLVWCMFPFHLWNSHTLLDELEIWYVITRHLNLWHGFSPIHLSYAISDLWIFQVDACLVDFFEHVQNCLAFLIFIDYLPLVQMRWNLTCLPCCGLWLVMIYLVIFGNV
jgi:hypothetical protein